MRIPTLYSRFSVAFRGVALRILALSLLMPVALLAAATGALDRFLASGAVKPGSVAVVVADLRDGRIIDSHNASLPLIPASILKSVTTATLLSNVGKDFRYATEVFADGPVEDGVLRGNLIVKGACDPTLGSSEEPPSADIASEVSEALRAACIRKVEGAIVLDEDDFTGPSCPPSWLAADLPHAYGTGSHAINYADNASGSRSVADPGSRLLVRLRTALGRDGVSVGAEPLPAGKRRILASHLSAPVDEIMRSCMMRSDNLFAESMLRTLSARLGGDGSTADGARRELSFWRDAAMPLDGVEIVDGSGLSRSNRVTADFMSSLLTTMSADPYYASFFPLAGMEGTLKKFLADTPLEGYIAMKTGSMKGIQCYAGYKLDDDYRPTHVVVVIVNDLTGSRAAMRQAASRYLLSLFSPDFSQE